MSAELDAYRAETQALRAEAAAFRAEVRAYRDEVVTWRERTDERSARIEGYTLDILRRLDGE